MFIGEIVSLPVFYLGVILFGMLINIICMPLVNYYAFSWAYGKDMWRGWRIADILIKVQIVAVVFQVVALIILVVGLVLSKNLFIPFF